MAISGEKENKLKNGELELWLEGQGAIQIRMVREGLAGKEAIG